MTRPRRGWLRRSPLPDYHPAVPAYRFPILVCEDHDGRFTACLVEDPDESPAVGVTYADAVRRLKVYLEWLHDKEPWRPRPDFLDASVVWIKVEVRPEYRSEDDGRKFPVHESLPLRVPCVRGRDEHGLFLCALPTLGLRFDFYEEKAFRELVTRYVQGSLEGKTPRELHRFLPPRAAIADDVIVHVPRGLGDRETTPTYPTLDAVAEPIGSRALRGRLLRPWERDAEVGRLVQTLVRERASVLLVGEGGVGKSAVLAEAVRKIEREGSAAAGKRPASAAIDQLLTDIVGGGKPDGVDGIDDDPLGDDALRARTPGGRHRFWLASAARLIAGAQYLGQWEERVEALIGELSQFDGVLCVEAVLDLVRAGGRAPGDSVGAFLVPYLQRGELRLIGEATPAELEALRRLLPGFADVFHIHVLPPFTRAQAGAALRRVADNLRQKLRVEAERGVTDLVYRLFTRFLPYQSFPGQATAFLTRVFDEALREKATTVTRGQVIRAFVKQTGVPEHLLRDDVLIDHAEVLAHFRSRVIGQDNACRTAADLVTTFKAGLNDPNRPVGVFLFAGPTGVGKTELARSISQYLFGHGDDADRMVRLDMSEYAGPGAAERLLGDPLGGGRPSDLVKRIRRQPFTVVLLDEIEKAAPEVFDVLLGVFDEGRLTDAFGRLSTFRSAVIVMTSNLGATAGEPFGLTRAAPTGAYEGAVSRFFRPEFINRIDAVVTFDALTEPTILLITEKELSELNKREGMTRAGLTLAWDAAVVRHLAAVAFDRRYGARPLQRTVESQVVTPLAKLLVDRPNLRNATVRVAVVGDGLSITAD
jgi:ATP-dependent Clp protease ATP-binding subunit ClpC